ncbi:MAG: methyltetrahydrofolate cobalamin methyltransferase [Acidobacteriota bacterium]|jgi:5-methyltetrahydrofolate--homocysteine methyltransferase|nr:methyltetrahydrofolate cobalamin methyltransferase [Acidobacteriota bacterium]
MIIIGEKINGSIPSMAKAIAEKNEEHIKNIAVAQANAGATFIDVCASVEPDKEVATLKWLIDLVQSVTDVPIAVDSPDPKVIAEALPFCKKPGLVNSISGDKVAGTDKDKIDFLLPIIADTKWEVIALLNGGTGIPKSAEDRLKVFDLLMAKAKEYKIAPSRFHIDPIIEALATIDEGGIGMVVEVMQEIKRREPTIHITGAVSNISFNLPGRKLVNQAFAVLAMNAGLDSAIFDPLNKDLLGMIYATEALLGNDEYCMEYIQGFRQGLYPAAPPAKK